MARCIAVGAVVLGLTFASRVAAQASPSIAIQTPSGGEFWYVGTTRYVKWTTVDLDNVVIYHSTDGGATYVLVDDLVLSTDADWGAYGWLIPDTPSSDCTVLLTGYFGEAPTESAVFEIRAVADADGDGMDDGWEVTCFGDLSHNQTTDADGDGLKDRDEFAGGTDPLNFDSVPTTVKVTPAIATLAPGASQVFTAEVLDQGGAAMTAFVEWGLDGGGSLDPGTGDATTFVSDGTLGTFTLSAIATAGAWTATGTATATVSDATAVHLKINCGDNSYTPAGWEDDDTYVSGGGDFDYWPVPVDPTGVPNAAPYDVYQTVRHRAAQGETHTYTIPVPNGDYIVRLHLGDGYETGGVPAFRDVKYVIEGVTVEDHMDYNTEAGVPHRALVKDYQVTVTDGDVVIQCESAAGTTSDVFEAGIEVFSGLPPELTAIDLTPASAALPPGATQDFTAETLDQYGYPFPTTVSWTVSGGGAVSPATGALSTFTSDGTEGTFTVTATSGSLTVTATVEVAAPVLTTLNVTPASATVFFGGTQQFTAEALDQFGDPVVADVSWTVESGGGSVDPATGATTTYTGGTTDGTFTLTAAATAGAESVTGTATVTVTSDSLLVEIVVTPGTATVEPGGTVQFTAEPKDQYGNAFPAAISWTVSGGGTLSPQTGLATIFTAGGALGGPFTVTAASGSVSGTATVTVAPPAPGAFNLLSPDGTSEVVPVETVIFTWEASSGAASYHFELAADEAFAEVILDEPDLTAESLEVAPGGLAAGATFYWRVTAQNASGGTPAANAPLSFATAAGPQSDHGFLGCRAGRRAHAGGHAAGLVAVLLAVVLATRGIRRSGRAVGASGVRGLR